MQVTEPGGPFILDEREVPTPGAGAVRVKVDACGICHSDGLVKFAAFPGISLPRVPGHEVAGTIDAVGVDCGRWKVGDRVGVGWHGGHCGQCRSCQQGHFINCPKGQVTGISFDGGYGEYMVVSHQALARIPDDLAMTDAGPLLCAGVTSYNALRNSGARPGDTVAVQGLGGLGHLAVQYARRMGFRTVVLSRGDGKRTLASELGAHEYIDTDADSAAEGLQRLGGADVLLATAPNAAAIGGAINGLTARGKLMLVAAPVEPFEVHAFSMLSGRAIQGWSAGTAIDSEDTMNFSQLTGVRPKVEVFPLDRANEAFQVMIENRARFRVVLSMVG